MSARGEQGAGCEGEQGAVSWEEQGVGCRGRSSSSSLGSGRPIITSKLSVLSTWRGWMQVRRGVGRCVHLHRGEGHVDAGTD